MDASFGMRCCPFEFKLRCSRVHLVFLTCKADEYFTRHSSFPSSRNHNTRPSSKNAEQKSILANFMNAQYYSRLYLNQVIFIATTAKHISVNYMHDNSLPLCAIDEFIQSSCILNTKLLTHTRTQRYYCTHTQSIFASVVLHQVHDVRKLKRLACAQASIRISDKQNTPYDRERKSTPLARRNLICGSRSTIPHSV